MGHGGGSDSRPEADRPMESRVGGALGMGDPEQSGRARDRARAPAPPGLRTRTAREGPTAGSSRAGV